MKHTKCKHKKTKRVAGAATVRVECLECKKLLPETSKALLDAEPIDGVGILVALQSRRPFRRPSWVEPEDEFQWVTYNPEYGNFDWATDDGKPSGNIFGDLYNLICGDNGDAQDYEILY